MQIKSYNKAAKVSWSNSKTHNQLLSAHSIDPDSQGLYHIDILTLDLTQRSKQLNVIGNAYYSLPISCTAWDTFGQKQGTLPYGIIFSGFDNGSFALWNPSDMISTYKKKAKPSFNGINEQQALMYFEETQQQNILCAQWNNIKNNLLAFGSSKVYILDIGKDINNPELMIPGKKNPHEGSIVTSVCWNKQVTHILASASQNGLVALWDIKKDRSIFQFKDNSPLNNQRNVSVSWSKGITTQIAVTFDDQKKSQIQIWQLRNPKGPIVVIEKGHNKGINSMDWSQNNKELLLTSGRDNKVICWNYTKDDDEMVSEVQMSHNVIDVKWSKKISSIYSVCTDNKVSICSLSDAKLFNYVPKSHKLSSISTLFGTDTIMTYSENHSNLLKQYHINLKNNKVLDQKLNSLESLLNGNRVQIQGQQFWQLIKAKNQGDDNEIYNFLGYNKQTIISQVEKYTGKRQAISSPKKVTKNKPQKKPKVYTNMCQQDAATFFQCFGDENQKNRVQDEQDDIQYDMIPRNPNWNTGKQKIIKQNILIGNYQGAIDAALKCGRTSQALIIAYSVDQQTFKSTMKSFFTETRDSFLTDILKHLTYKQNEQLVRKYDINEWKECIAIIMSISTNQNRLYLLHILILKLKQSLNLNQISCNHPIILCSILADDFQFISKIFKDNINHQIHIPQKKSKTIHFTELLISIYPCLRTTPQFNSHFTQIINSTALIAIEQGRSSLAFKLVSTYAPNSKHILNFICHNNQELSEHIKKYHFKFVNLPIMQAPKKDIKTKENLAKIPSNIANKIPKRGAKTDAFSANEATVTPTKDRNVPPPPPPVKVPPKKEPESQQSTRDPPRPPPNVKIPHQQKHQEQIQTITSNKNLPPPPPPSNKQTKAPPSTQQSRIPPPFTQQPQQGYPPKQKEEIDSQQYSGSQVQEQPVRTTAMKKQKQSVPPPRPQKTHNEMGREHNSNKQPYSEVKEGKTEQKRNPPPPPPPASKAKGKNVPKVQQQAQEEAEDQQTQQTPHQTQIRRPPPPPPRKAPPRR